MAKCVMDPTVGQHTVLYIRKLSSLIFTQRKTSNMLSVILTVDLNYFYPHILTILHYAIIYYNPVLHIGIYK